MCARFDSQKDDQKRAGRRPNSGSLGSRKLLMTICDRWIAAPRLAMMMVMAVRLEVKKARKGGALLTQANTCFQAGLLRHDPRDAPRARCPSAFAVQLGYWMRTVDNEFCS